MAKDTLARYRAKRDFSKTPEPKGQRQKAENYSYLIQKHAASHLHYDFRLELDGTLKSWAVPRGPSLDPKDRRLAVEVEDHPLEYGTFEGTIPKGQYGGGTVMLWDQGSWEPLEDPHAGLKKGKLVFKLHGKRLHGTWTLARMHTKDEKRHNWLLIKKEDADARPGDADALLSKNTTSVATKRTMEQIAAGNKVWQSNRAQTVEKKSSATPGVKKKRKKDRHMPGFIAPELATLTETMPKGDEWVHEIKFDGYRALAYKNGDSVRMFTRNGNDWTEKFAPLPALLESLEADSAILDGEVVALDAQGASSFKELQNAMDENASTLMQYYVFDLLYLNGQDLRKLPLLQRKEKLATLIPPHSIGGQIFYSEHFSGLDNDFFQQVCRLKLEGVVSKRADAPYRSGRDKSWLKSKCHMRQEFVIGGFTLPSTGALGIGALLLGYYDGNTLKYAGKVGTGFDNETSRRMRKQLEQLRIDTMAYAQVPTDGRRGAMWVKPQLVCEVEFTEWTPDGRLRHPSFQGLREDKKAKDVKRDIPIEPVQESKEHPVTTATKSGSKQRASVMVGGIAITHPDRVIYPQSDITKQRLAEYYLSVADAILPHVEGRPLSMIRCPEGTGEPCFFQRHIARGQSPYLHEVPIQIKTRRESYLMIRDVEGLITLIQWGVIELHPWGCRADKPELPDRLIFDLDPAPDAPWKNVIAGAKDIRQRMQEFGLESFVKTTGGKGLHVVMPIKRHYGWKTIKAFAKAIAESMAHDQPNIYTTTISKAARPGKIFVDYLRNDLTSTAVAAFSARARPGAAVATPLAWTELKSSLSPARFTIETVPKRLTMQKHDPWADFFRLRQSLSASHLRALKIPLE